MKDKENHDMQKTKAKKRDIKWIASENAPTYYTNSINIGMSIFDLTLKIGIVEAASEDVLSMRELAQVIMSPQHAKIFAAVLRQKIEKYEKDFGPLPEVSDSIVNVG